MQKKKTKNRQASSLYLKKRQLTTTSNKNKLNAAYWNKVKYHSNNVQYSRLLIQLLLASTYKQLNNYILRQ